MHVQRNNESHQWHHQSTCNEGQQGDLSNGFEIFRDKQVPSALGQEEQSYSNQLPPTESVANWTQACCWWCKGHPGPVGGSNLGFLSVPRSLRSPALGCGSQHRVCLEGPCRRHRHGVWCIWGPFCRKFKCLGKLSKA